MLGCGAMHSISCVRTATSRSRTRRRTSIDCGPSSRRSEELLSEPDENSFGAADVAEPIRLFVLDHFADELRATPAEPDERLVDVVHSAHAAQAAERVHRG